MRACGLVGRALVLTGILGGWVAAQPALFYFTPDKAAVYRWSGGTLQKVYSAPAGREITGLAVDEQMVLFTNEVTTSPAQCPAVLVRGGAPWTTLANRCSGDVFVEPYGPVWASATTFCACGGGAELLRLDAQGSATPIYPAPATYRITDVATAAGGRWYTVINEPAFSWSRLVIDGQQYPFLFYDGREVFATPSGAAWFSGNRYHQWLGGDSIWFLDRSGSSRLQLVATFPPPWVVTGLAADDTGNYVATVSDASGWLAPYLVFGSLTSAPTYIGPIADGGNQAGDVFVPPPPALRTIGAAAPGCAGDPTIRADSWPYIGNAAFALHCDNAPAGAPGALLLGPALPSPVIVAGVQLWIHPGLATLLSVAADAAGIADVALPIPSYPWLVGQTLSTQVFWLGPTAPPPCPPLGLSASAGLEITFQS